MPTSEEQRLKRAACLIASQLPEDSAEALRVLDYAKDIIHHLTVAAKPGWVSGVIPLATAHRYQGAAREGGQEARTDSRDIANPA